MELNKTEFPTGNQKGQLVIEAVLILVILMGAWYKLSKQATSGKWLQKLVEDQTDSVNGMIESGNWRPQKAARKYHPNFQNRSVSSAEEGQ